MRCGETGVAQDSQQDVTPILVISSGPFVHVDMIVEILVQMMATLLTKDINFFFGMQSNCTE